MKNGKSVGGFIVALIFFGVLSMYIMQLGPSAVLMNIGEHFGITDNNALMNLPVNVVFPFIIIGCFAGTPIDKRFGTYRLYALALALTAIGLLLNFAAGSSFALLIAARGIFGLGFGLGIPFIGSAIMQWFSPAGREKMNTLNGWFPYIGQLIMFAAIAPIAVVMGWQFGMGVWGILAVVVLVLWLACVKKDRLPNLAEDEDDEAQGSAGAHLYRDLFSYRAIKLLIVVFALDYANYSFIAAVLPTLIMNGGDWSESVAGIAAAVVFPGLGVVGALLGGVTMSKTGRRKICFLIGSAFELAGIVTIFLGAEHSVAFILLGVVLFALGNGFWLPPMYCVPMELKGMTPVMAGAAFAVISAAGFALGFFSPIIGGMLADFFVASESAAALGAGGAYVFGIKNAMMIFGLVYIVNLICFAVIEETGPGKKGGVK